MKRPLRPAALIALLLAALSPSAEAQTFMVIHDFTAGVDGSLPYAGLTMDRAGSLYGTTSAGGTAAHGSVFRLKPSNGSWLLNTLYSFDPLHKEDGASPESRVVFGPDGSLYGTANYGGISNCTNGCGTVYKLRPPEKVCKSAQCYWTETILYEFTGGNDGGYPGLADLVFDRIRNIYGTTYEFGASSVGVVYQLSSSGGGWTQNVLLTFDRTNGQYPESGLLFDQAGNLYGVASYGGQYTHGVAYQLVPSGSGWSQNVLHSFQGSGDGIAPFGGLISDSAGNLYGTTAIGGTRNLGTVFELSPSGGGWNYSLLYSFTDQGTPQATLAMDAAGNLYGTTYGSADGEYGTVFKLSPSSGGWTYTTLHTFTGGHDGAHPWGSVALDAAGNLYGTTPEGGAYGAGVVWEIMPSTGRCCIATSAAARIKKSR